MSRTVRIRLVSMLRTETGGIDRVVYADDARAFRAHLRSIDCYTRYAHLSAFDADAPEGGEDEYVGPQVLLAPTVYVDAKVVSRADVLRQYPNKRRLVERMRWLGLSEALVSRSGDVVPITAHRIPGDKAGKPLDGYAYAVSAPARPAVAALVDALRSVPELVREATTGWSCELWACVAGERSHRVVPLPPGVARPVDPLPEDVALYMVHHDAFVVVDGITFEHLTGAEDGPYVVLPRTYRLETLERLGTALCFETIAIMKQNRLAWAYEDVVAQRILPVYSLDEIVDRLGQPIEPAKLEQTSIPSAV